MTVSWKTAVSSDVNVGDTAVLSDNVTVVPDICIQENVIGSPSGCILVTNSPILGVDSGNYC